MRSAVFASLLLLLASVPGAAADDDEFGAHDLELDRSSDDLLCKFESWDSVGGRFAMNRWAILDVSRRATPVAAGALRPKDAAARTRAHDALVAAMASKDGFIASEAALALGLGGDAKDIPTLAGLVATRKRGRRMMRYAALGLGELPIGDAQQATAAREALLGGLKTAWGRGDAASGYWVNCGCALAMRGDAAAVPGVSETLQRLFKDPDNKLGTSGEAVGACCLALGALGGEAFLPELEDRSERRLPSFMTGSFLWNVVQAARRAGGAKALPFLRKAAVRDNKNESRSVALHALGVVAGPKDEEAVKILKGAVISDNDVPCREAAAFALGRTGHPSAGEHLFATLDRMNSAERPSVIVGIGLAVRATPDSKQQAAMVKALERCTDVDDRIAWTIACGLAHADGARAAIAELVPRKRKGPGVPAACFASGILGADAATTKLLHEVVEQDADPTSRREAAIALGILRDHDVVKQLRDIVGSNKRDDADRASAAVCLGLVGDDADIDALLAVLADKRSSDPLKACVVHGLGRLLDHSEGKRLREVVAEGRLHGLRQDGIDPWADLHGLLE